MRSSRNAFLMDVAIASAGRGECVRRQVGCVISDEKGRILSTGCNGVAPGQIPCIDTPCPGAKFKSGTGLDVCHASHSEISALVTLEKPFEAAYIHCTTAPCIACTKALLLTSIHTIVFAVTYPTNGKDLWEASGRKWVVYKSDATQSEI